MEASYNAGFQDGLITGFFFTVLFILLALFVPRPPKQAPALKEVSTRITVMTLDGRVGRFDNIPMEMNSLLPVIEKLVEGKPYAVRVFTPKRRGMTRLEYDVMGDWFVDNDIMTQAANDTYHTTLSGAEYLKELLDYLYAHARTDTKHVKEGGLATLPPIHIVPYSAARPFPSRTPAPKRRPLQEAPYGFRPIRR